MSMIKATTRLKDKRLERGLTQKQLAEKIGVSWRVVQHWERYGLGRAKASSVKKVADFFGCRMEDLLEQDGDCE